MILSKFRGVRRTHPNSQWQAVETWQGVDTLIGMFDSEIESVQALDAATVKRVGVLRAYQTQLLQRPEDYETAYREAKQKQDAAEAELSESVEAAFRAKALDPDSEREAWRMWTQEALSVDRIAAVLGFHIENVRAVLRQHEEERQRDLGLEQNLAPTVITSSQIREYIHGKFIDGLSIRQISEQMGLDRKTIARLAASEE